MNMYSQYTPQPVGLPLLLPVPLVLPVNTDGSESTVKSTKESLHPENLQGELNIRPETETEQSEEGQKHGQMIKEEEGHKPSSLQDHASSCSSDLRTDFKPTFDNQEDFFDTSAGPVTHPPGRQTSPPVSDEDMPSSPLPHLPPLSPPSALETPQRSPVAPPPPILVPQTLDKDKNKDCNLEQLSKKDEQDTPETDFTQLVSSKQNTLKSECGVDAWKRWIKWRESQTNLEPVSSHALTLKADLLRCSVAELSDCLLCFIREVKQSDGEPYSLNRLFYLCLSIQLSSIAEAAQRSFLPPARSELPSQQPSVVLARPSQ